ncbi:hypothetical protein GGH14_003762, partial [Coemansia sp. RSA 370]
PAVPQYTPPVGAHSLPAIRSPGTSTLQPMPPPQLQQQPYQPAQQAYYSNTLGTSASQQYAYYAQQHTPQSHASAYSQSGSTPASSASGFAPAQARFLNAASSNPQQQFSHQQLGLVAQASPVTSVTPASS